MRAQSAIQKRVVMMACVFLCMGESLLSFEQIQHAERIIYSQDAVAIDIGSALLQSRFAVSIDDFQYDAHIVECQDAVTIHVAAAGAPGFNEFHRAHAGGGMHAECECRGHAHSSERDDVYVPLEGLKSLHINSL